MSNINRIKTKENSQKTTEKSFEWPSFTKELGQSEYKIFGEIGFFSINHDREIKYDQSQMKYYVPRENPVHLDLNVGFENTKFRSEIVDESEKMNHLLQWIVKHNFEFFKTSKREVDFISQRGTLRKIMLVHQNNEEKELIICATKFKGVIYMVSVNSDSSIASYRAMTPRDRRHTSWGHTFEKYMTADEPNGEPDLQSSTHELEEFCIVVHSEFAGYSLIFKAEIDGMHSDCVANHSPEDTSCYVEIKTRKKGKNARKLLEHWAHAHLVGIKRVVYGYKNDDGIVEEIKDFQTSRLPQRSRNPELAQQMMNCLDYFLYVMKQEITQDNPNVVYKVSCLSKVITITEMWKPEERYKIIPEWYVSAYKENF